VGVAGIGRLGRAHVRVLRSLPGVEFVGCYDTDASRARKAADEFGAAAFPSLDALISEVEALSVVTPTSAHAAVAVRALEAGRDVFVEKPITGNVEDGERVVRCARERGRILQVGHIERFNPAIEAVLPRIGTPLFIEVHRLAPFTIRGTDVSVVMDLMIHDLDLLGLLVGRLPGDIRARGAALLTEEPDIVNARLEYPDGCVANVTASRVTATPMRKVRVFSANGYFSIDLLSASATHTRKVDDFTRRLAKARAGGAEPVRMGDLVTVEEIRGDGVEPLVKELGAFCRCLRERTTPRVSGEDGLEAVRLASAVLDRVGRARA
jgi:predicted dehydrogenase